MLHAFLTRIPGKLFSMSITHNAFYICNIKVTTITDQNNRLALFKEKLLAIQFFPGNESIHVIDGLIQ